MAEKQLQSFYNVGPGDYILDFLDSFGWTQNDLADVTGFSLKSINQLINNKQGITPETAITLEKVFGSPAEFWLNVDAKYQIRKKHLFSIIIFGEMFFMMNLLLHFFR